MSYLSSLKPQTQTFVKSDAPMRDIYLSVIIPAYNEEKRISKTLDEISYYLSRQAYTYEILVVSEGSTDRTSEVVKAKMTAIKHLRLLDLKENRGKGHAVKNGMLDVSGRICLFTDADNSTDISHFEKMKPLFDKSYEVVICSRDSKDVSGAKQEVAQAWYKRLLGNMGNIFIQIVAVRGIWDTQCGFKAFRGFASEKIFSQTRIMGFGFDIEVLALARLFGYNVGIVPAKWVNDADSHVRFSSYLKVLWETVLVRWFLWRGVYNKN